MMMREFLDRWLASAESSLKLSTYRRHADFIRLHTVPMLGNIRLAKLSNFDVERFYADQLDAGLSPTTFLNPQPDASLRIEAGGSLGTGRSQRH
jgi:Phage integrase, N-terminal SAM-like domain